MLEQVDDVNPALYYILLEGPKHTSFIKKCTGKKRYHIIEKLEVAVFYKLELIAGFVAMEQYYLVSKE